MTGARTTETTAAVARPSLSRLHLPRHRDGLRAEAGALLAYLLPNASVAVLVYTEHGATVELAVGGRCPLVAGTTVARDAWEAPHVQRAPMRYAGREVGDLRHDAREGAFEQSELDEFVSHLTIALVNLRLEAEAARATEHYCASLQAFEQGVILFQERAPEAIGARFLELMGSLLGTSIGALYVLEKVGDATSPLRLDQIRGLPESLLAELRTPDDRWFPATVVQRPAAALQRDPVTREIKELDASCLPDALVNVVHCPLRYHGLDVGLALAFNARSDGELAIQVERVRRLSELGAALFHRLELEREALEKRELQTQIAIAASIQRRLIPADPPTSPVLRCAWRSQPAQLVGGDYLDLLDDLDGRVHAVVADVSGHGIDSALLMASCRAAYRAECARMYPDRLLARLNDTVCSEVGDTGMFVTLALLRFSADGRQAVYASAGHNPALLFRRANGTVEWLPSTGSTLGMFAGMTYECTELNLAQGDTVLLYTDGVVEATDARNEMFGDKRLEVAFLAAAPSGAQAVLEAVRAALRTFLGSRPCEDDVSISVIEVV